MNTMNWYELALNPQAVSQLYAETPLLEGVELVEVVLHRDGPKLQMKFNIPQLPDHPPDRWIRNGYNAAQMQLDFFDVAEVQMLGWSTSNQVDVKIDRNAEGRIGLKVEGGPCSMSASSGFFRIAHVSGYLRAEPLRSSTL